MIRQCFAILITLLLSSTLAQAQGEVEWTARDIAWSPDGQRIALSLTSRQEEQGLIQIYNVETLELERTLWNVTGGLASLAWSPDSQWLVTNDWGNHSNIRNAATGALRASFGIGYRWGDPDIIESSAWSYDGSLMANMYWRWIDIRDGRSANTLRMLGSIEHEIGDITSFAWSDHENLIAIATYDNKIYLFDPLANEIIREFDTDMRIHLGLWRGNYLYTVRDYFSSNVDELVDYQYASQVWDVNSGQRVSSFAIGRYDSVGCRRYSPNGRWLMATRPGSIVQIWDTFTGTVVQSQQFEISACPVWNPDSSSLALANHAGDLQIVNLPLTGERFPFPSADIVFFAVNSDIGTALRVAKLSEAPVDTTVDYIGYYSLGVGGLSYGTEPPYYEVSPDYRRWLYARQDEAGHYNIFEDRISYGGELLPIVRGGWNLYPTYSPAEFSDDAEIAYLHSDDETHFDLLVLGTDRETSQPVLADRQPYLEAPAWVPSPDHRQLTIALQTAMGDYDIYLLDLNEQTLDPIIQHAANDHSPAWSPDGSKLLFVSDRNQEESIFLFDRATESTQFVVIGNHPDWSPDGTRIVFTHDEAVYVTDILGEDIQLFIEGAFSPHWMLIAY